MEKTIAAISTPIGRGAVGIVRISGPKALKIALDIFSCNEKEIKPRYMYLGKIKDELIKDKCLMVYFKSPYSYTGEDVVEFQIHGGQLIIKKVLELILSHGSSLAEPGEFSKRAFLNGKISLDEAEGIIGIINAESEAELRASMSMSLGKLNNFILNIQDTLKDILAEIEVNFDYPENDDEQYTKDEVFKKLDIIMKDLEKVLNDNKNMKYIRDGINVSIVGKPNAGKSSLLNAFLGENRAIVTDIEGTTRDSLTESLFYKGIKINLIDTAGIRDSDDKVESIGINRSKQLVKESDIVLFIMDGSSPISQEDIEIEKLIKNKRFIKIVNKADLKRVLQVQKNEINVSAKESSNLQSILEKIYDMVIGEEIDYNGLMITNQRFLETISDVINLFKEIQKEASLSLDLVEVKIKKVYMTLGKITGKGSSEDIIDVIFSKFCLGK